MNFTQIKELDQRYVLQTYSRNPVAIDHGRGATLWDTEGKEYIDFTSGPTPGWRPSWSPPRVWPPYSSATPAPRPTRA